MLVRALGKPGRMLYALAMACFGAHYLVFARGSAFARPGPPWFPDESTLSWLAGASLLGAGISLALEWRPRWIALLLGAGFLLRVALIHIPQIAMNVHDPGSWTSAVEIMSLSGGAFAIAATLADIPDVPARLAQCIFAAPLFVVGAQHFLYAHFVATLIPAWIPAPLFWPYFVGVAFIASALAIIFRRLEVPASSLLGLMFLLWVVILHLPRVIADQRNGNEWTSLFVALGMAASAWSVTGSFARPD